MALRCMKLLRTVRSASLLRNNVFSTAIDSSEAAKPKKEFRTEGNLKFFEDPDNFGTLSWGLNKDKVVLEDEGDIQEEKHLKNTPLPSQQLTTKQYADIIKQYLGHKRLKEALNVLEVRMLKEDRVKPENYIYNILIGACADVGYTKKAFSLYNDMKKRALIVTGDTYTCLFHACSNSPFASDGLKRATHLRELMKEKGIEPNLTNYNAMIKAFGRCGDLAAAFQIVDEMISKDIKIRVHTFNHMLQACISDKENGLRHALIVWRKMLKMREKPNIYSFNLMLKCVKDCNMGSKADIEDLIGVIQDQIALENQKKVLLSQQSKSSLVSQSQTKRKSRTIRNEFEVLADLKPNYFKNENIKQDSINELNTLSDLKPFQTENYEITNDLDSTKESAIAVSLGPENQKPDPPDSGIDLSAKNMSLQLVKLTKLNENEMRRVPNLLSKELQLEQVLSLQEVKTLQEKFAVIGGLEDFLKEMQAWSVKPDIKIFTQMLPLLEETEEAEIKLLDAMKALDLKADIDFYNMLIKKRCLRLDYDAAFAVREMIEKESKLRKRKYPLKKKWRLRPNIMTYGVLAMACKTIESAQQLLNDMKEERIKVNIEILGTMLRNGAKHCDFEYVLHIMKVVKEENIQVNHIMLKHLEEFKERATKIIKLQTKEKSDVILESHKTFTRAYKNWLKEINPEEALKVEHPWSQFKNTYPETVQRQSFVIEEPKKFYKRDRKGVKYVPTM